MRLKKEDEFRTLYKLTTTLCSVTGKKSKSGIKSEESMPKHVVIGRRGHVYYIGPMLNNKDLQHLVQQSISDNSFAVDIIRNFKV